MKFTRKAYAQWHGTGKEGMGTLTMTISDSVTRLFR